MKPEIAYVYDKLRKLRFDFHSIDFRDFRSSYRYEPTLNRYVRKDDNDLFIDKNTFKPLEEELEYADKCHKLEEEIGCPLDVVFKATAQKKVFAGTCWLGKLSLEYISKDNEWWLTNGWTAYSVRLKDYQKTWWLKADKSE